MIGGLFIYNHKGEVLISRVYRDDIGWVFIQAILIAILKNSREINVQFGVKGDGLQDASYLKLEMAKYH